MRKTKQSWDGFLERIDSAETVGGIRLKNQRFLISKFVQSAFIQQKACAFRCREFAGKERSKAILMNFRKYGKKTKITSIITVLLCLILSVSACGTGKKAEAEETDGDSSQVQDFEESISQENIEEATIENMNSQNMYTLSSTVEEVVNDPCFEDFGRLGRCKNGSDAWK